MTNRSQVWASGMARDAPRSVRLGKEAPPTAAVVTAHPRHKPRPHTLPWPSSGRTCRVTPRPAQRAFPMAKLVCQTGPKAGHEYPLTKDVTVMGRQSSCDVQILDNMSSRAHCQIRRDGKLYSLVDLGSRNGSHLNDKKVSERQLAFGDRVRIGEAEYKFVKEPGDVELKDLLSKYEVQEKIGEGGMGIVYKANQKSMNRIVALKILSPKYSAKQRFVDQFIKEARAAGALNHPNIIQVHDVGTENDIHYFSMEFVEGATCMQVLREEGQIGRA